jgi:hypothetical protein
LVVVGEWRSIDDFKHKVGCRFEGGVYWWRDDNQQSLGHVPYLRCRLKGDEEVVGGFDLIYRGKEIGIGSATSYTTMLGCKNNRIENIKKLARATAFRLAK